MRKIVFLILAFSLFATTADASYNSTLSKWTRRGQAFTFDTLDAKIMWYGTYLSREFRDARVLKEAELLNWSDAEVESALAEEEFKSRAGQQFLICFFAPRGAADFDLNEASLWKITLITATNEAYEPTGLEKVEINTYNKVFYPYLDRWSKAYIVTFPDIRLGAEFTLEMRSVVGKSALHWKIHY